MFYFFNFKSSVLSISKLSISQMNLNIADVFYLCKLSWQCKQSLAVLFLQKCFQILQHFSGFVQLLQLHEENRKIWNAISKYFSDSNTILLLSSFCLSVCLSILLFISLCLFLNLFLSVLSVRLFVCMIVCLFVFLVNSLYFSFCLSAWWSFSYQLICLS